ncbi:MULTISPECIES: hypothetical protein [Mesorhizobium]|jgi:hypothetical protein|uniref:hypothetical protein n=1 Tax=Mesorhizobium TaxID=68287 RepID=UPI0012DB1EB9|nr:MULTISPECIES: hypothetical protein [Mesorhizobium]
MTDATMGNSFEDSHPQARRRIGGRDLATEMLGFILRPVESNDVERRMRAGRDVMDKYEVALQSCQVAVVSYPKA